MNGKKSVIEKLKLNFHWTNKNVIFTVTFTDIQTFETLNDKMSSLNTIIQKYIQ